MWVVVALPAVLVAFGIAHAAVPGLIPDVPAARNLGEVGAACGVAAVLLSGFALVASGARQGGQLRGQQDDLAAQRARPERQRCLPVRQTRALIETSRAQSSAAKSLKGRPIHMSERGRLGDCDRRPERFVELQVGLGDEALEVDVAFDISRDEARGRLGRLYPTTPTILLGEPERLRDDPAPASRADGLERELRTGLRWEERVLLYPAVVPPSSRLPAG